MEKIRLIRAWLDVRRQKRTKTIASLVSTHTHMFIFLSRLKQQFHITYMYNRLHGHAQYRVEMAIKNQKRCENQKRLQNHLRFRPASLVRFVSVRSTILVKRAKGQSDVKEAGKFCWLKDQL